MALIHIRRSAFSEPRLAKVADYFYEHISDPAPMSSEKAARIACLCPQYFSTYFRQRVGVCFRVWQGAERTDHARNMLLSGRTQVRAAALASGYADSSAFARAFRLYQGITARQLVRLLRAHPELESALRKADSPKVVLELTQVAPQSVTALTEVTHLLLRLSLHAASR